jgi:hypothetical protein
MSNNMDSENILEETNISETEIFDVMINKINSIKNILIDIKSYTENVDCNKKKKYLEKLLSVSLNIQKLYADSKDLFDEYIMQLQPEDLKENDKIQQKNLLINKNIQKIFLPYMLYFQIILQNLN